MKWLSCLYTKTHFLVCVSFVRAEYPYTYFFLIWVYLRMPNAKILRENKRAGAHLVPLSVCLLSWHPSEQRCMKSSNNPATVKVNCLAPFAKLALK